MYLANGFDAFISKPVDSSVLDKYLIEFIRDRHPPEVVEAARRERGDPAESAANAESELLKFVIMDAKNTIEVFEGKNFDSLEGSDMHEIIVSAHGIRNALDNIGEENLAGVARDLEKAAEGNDLTAMSELVPALINGLKVLVERIEPVCENDDVSEQDMSLLRKKLLEIRTSCLVYDKRAVKLALEELQQKTWPREINDVLDELSVHILHSSFRKAAELAEKTAG
jgi:HPt (histidine-containing phosphotransfer) domain-containing protein